MATQKPNHQEDIEKIWDKWNHLDLPEMQEVCFRVAEPLVAYLAGMIERNVKAKVKEFSGQKSKEAERHLGLCIGQFTRSCFLIGVEYGSKVSSESISKEIIQIKTLEAAHLLQSSEYAIVNFFKALIGGLHSKAKITERQIEDLSRDVNANLKRAHFGKK